MHKLYNRNGINNVLITNDNHIIVNIDNHKYLKLNNNNFKKVNICSPIHNWHNPKYHPYYGKSDLHTLQSVTKSIVSLLFGIAIQKKICDISIIDDTINKFVDFDKRIKIKHLLTMTSGIEWDIGNGYDETNIMERSSDWIKYILNKKIIDEPGTKMKYKDCDAVLFGKILEYIIGENLESFAVRNLFIPLGIDKYYWKKMPNSNSPDMEGGLYLDIQSLVKIGKLILNKGKYNNVRIVSKDYMHNAFNNYNNDKDNYGYGFYWWLTDNAIFAWGYGGQYLFILPKQKIIGIIYQWLNPKEIQPDEFYQQIKNIIKYQYPIDIIVTSGSHYKIGFDIGHKCRKHINNLYDFYYGKIDIGSISKLLDMTENYLMPIKKIYPQYYDEIKGISDGSEIDIKKICLLIFDEISYLKLGCTDMIARRKATKNNTTFVVHTNDLGEEVFNHMVIIYMKADDEPEIMGISIGGLIFSAAINSHMLCFTGNEISSNDVKKYGIPRNVIFRATIATITINDAFNACINKNKASSYNTIITSRDGNIISVEGSATDYDIIYPTNDTLVHTNHYISPTMVKYEKYRQDMDITLLDNDSYTRLFRANYLIKEKYGKMDINSMIDFSMDYGWLNVPSSAICKSGRKLYTVFSFIVEMETKTIIIGLGNYTCQKKMYKLRFPIMSSST